MDPQEGADDEQGSEWEKDLQRELEEDQQQQQTSSRQSRGTFILFCFSPRTDESPRRSLPRLPQPRNLAQPGKRCIHLHVFILVTLFSSLSLDSSLVPLHQRPVSGVALLWQPEIVLPYLAVMDKYSSNTDLVEAATGAIQNLTACSWKVR